MNEPQETGQSEILVREDESLASAAILRLLDKPLSEEDLREATERVARPLELAEKDVVRLLVFRQGEELMAIESVLVNQVMRAADVHRIPHRTNKIIRGLCNLDGELMLCGDLSKLLELSEGRDSVQRDLAQRRMILLGDEENRWVVDVDEVRGVASVARKDLRRPPITVDAALARYTKGIVPLDDALAAMLDVERIISGFQVALR